MLAPVAVAVMRPPLLLVPVLPELELEPELEPLLDELEDINPRYRSSVAPSIEVDPSKASLTRYHDSPTALRSGRS